jgi:hypothetical protein
MRGVSVQRFKRALEVLADATSSEGDTRSAVRTFLNTGLNVFGSGERETLRDWAQSELYRLDAAISLPSPRAVGSRNRRRAMLLEVLQVLDHFSARAQETPPLSPRKSRRAENHPVPSEAF